MDRNVDPAAPEVQQLRGAVQRTRLPSGFAREGLRRLEWNASIARKTFAYGQRLLEQTATEGEELATEGKLGDYLYAARMASKLSRAFAPLAEEAKALSASRQSPTVPCRAATRKALQRSVPRARRRRPVDPREMDRRIRPRASELALAALRRRNRRSVGFHGRRCTRCRSGLATSGATKPLAEARSRSVHPPGKTLRARAPTTSLRLRSRTPWSC